MTDKVFVDTGGWLAFMIKKDRHHKPAREYFIKLRKNNVPLITSNYVISETLTWLNYNNYHDIASEVMHLWQEAEQTNLLSVDWVDRNIAAEAWEIFQSFSDHRLSFTDCTSFAICRKSNIKKVFGFDRHFNVLGFLLSPYQVHENGVEYDILGPGQGNEK